MKKHLLPLLGLLLVTGQALAETKPIARPTASRLAAANSTYTTIASSANPSTVGASVTFTATVKDSDFFSPQTVNEGTVTFSEGATVLAADVPVAAGVATFSTAGLSAGSHAITAVYNGTANFSTSTGSVAQTVDDPGSCPTYAGNIAYVNASATPGTNDGTTWANAFLTLQGALDAARTCGVTQIWVAQGTYVPTNHPIGAATTQFSGGLTSADFSFHLINGVAIYGGFSGSGTETLLSQRNWVQNPTILSGSNARYHVVTSVNDGSSTRLDGFTVTGGNANGIGSLTVEGSSFNRSIGGGVVMLASSLRLENLVVTGNASSSFGIGGIYASNGSPTLTNVAVLNHSTGGMVYVTGSVNPLVITMTNVVFAGNSISGIGGGLQVNGQNMTANLTNVVFYNNTASTYAGGLVSAACTTNLVNCTFYGNSAPEGGAMKNVNNATVNDKNGIYYNNDISTQSGSAFNATTTLTGTDPKFVNAADPDGPDNRWMTADDGLALQSTSPAINAGTLAGAPATDILGVARTGNPDQGAYEFNPCVTPTAFTVTGGGGYCADGSGVAIGLSGSESGVSYQLKNGNANVGSAVAGTGNALSFGNQTAAGTYTVLASRSETCTATMTGSATVIVNPLPNLSSATASPNPLCEGQTLTLTATASGGTGNLTYDWSGPNAYDPDPTTTNPLTRSSATALFAGSYSVTVSDQNGCQASGQTSSVSVSPPPTSLPAPTLAAGAVLCAGQPLSVGVASVDCASGLTAQLSDKTGDFTTPTATWSVVGGSNQLSLPVGLPSGSGYRVRLVSSAPALTSPPSEAFTVTALGVAQLTTPSKICQGDALPVSFSIGGSCPFPTGNAFTVQLSSATGSFANPRILGTAQVGTTTFPASLLSGLSAGTGYRVRIVTTNPATTSSASLPFKLEGPNLNLTPTVGGAPVCRGSAVGVSFTLASCPFFEGNAFTAQLSSATGSFNNPTTLGTVLAGQPNSLTIPAGVSAGSGYRIRIVSSNPVASSSSSAPFQVKVCPARMSAEEPQLVVSPNPVSGGEIRCHVRGMDSPAFSLTTFAGRGVGILVKTDGSGEFILTPKQQLAAGVYVLQASEGTTRLTQRVLVAE